MKSKHLQSTECNKLHYSFFTSHSYELHMILDQLKKEVANGHAMVKQGTHAHIIIQSMINIITHNLLQGCTQDGYTGAEKMAIGHG
jgi:hypothetical protein